MKQGRKIYFLFLIAAFLYAYFYGGKVPYMLLYIMILLPVVSILYTLIVFSRFKYTQELDKKYITKGDVIHFIFKIKNEDFFAYPYIGVNFYGDNKIFGNNFSKVNFSLMPFKSRSISLELQCNYRGKYYIGIKNVEIEDFFGLFRFKYPINDAKAVTVYPKIIYLDNFSLKSDYISESQSVVNSLDEDMTTISDIRPFISGDSMKRIHWKLTAKTANILVKKYQCTSKTNTIILLDLFKNNFDSESNIIIEDKVIEAVVSVLHYCLYNWIPVEMVYYDKNLARVSGKNPLMFTDMYNIISDITFTSTVPVCDILDVITSDTLDKNNILIFTSNLDYSLYNQIYKAGNSGFDVSLIYISPEELTQTSNPDIDKMLSTLSEISVNNYKINIDDNITQVFAE